MGGGVAGGVGRQAHAGGCGPRLEDKGDWVTKILERNRWPERGRDGGGSQHRGRY